MNLNLINQQMQYFIERQIVEFKNVYSWENDNGSLETSEETLKSFLLSFQREMVERLEQELPEEKEPVGYGKMGSNRGYNRALAEVKSLLSKMKQ